MMLQSGRDWWRSGWLGPRWYQYYPAWVNGFDTADFGNWVLHGAISPTQWYMSTTDVLYGDGSAVIGAGSPELMTERYRIQRAQHGLNLTQYIVEFWLKYSWVHIYPEPRIFVLRIGLGTTTFYYDLDVVNVSGIGSGSEPWAHYRVTFYKHPVNGRRWAKVERWDGTSWVFVREKDYLAVGDWSGLPWIFFDCRTPMGGQMTCGLDQLEMYAKYM